MKNEAAVFLFLGLAYPRIQKQIEQRAASQLKKSESKDFFAR